MPLRSYKPTSRRPAVHDPLDVRGDHDPRALQAAPGADEARLRPQQPGPPHRPPSRRRREAPLPDHRLQARQARRAGQGRDGRVRPEPLGPHRPPPLPGRREALHAPAARPQGRRRRRRRPGRRGPGGERPAAREHPARHHDPQHRARAGQGRPDRPLRRRERPAARQGGRLRDRPPPVGRDAPRAAPLHGDRRPGLATWTTRTRASARPAGPATWASARRPAASR